MRAPTNDEIQNLRGPILSSVSRSFYLSLRILPRALRDPISLAYLLARATDTIADTAGPDSDFRKASLRDLAGAIQGNIPRENMANLRNSFAPLQSNEAERVLILALPLIIGWLDLLSETDRLHVREVLQKINQGQMLDLDRFGTSFETAALANAAELDEYTYLVAGSVGEFWTSTCLSRVRNFSDRHDSEMREMGMEYGKGLQLTNILRDLASDLRQGRCYLPASELHSLGIMPAEILRAPAKVEPITRRWRERAEHNLATGIDYACAIRAPRVRFATALPALIGTRTLALLRQAGTEAFERKIKLARAEVRTIIFATAVTLAAPSALKRMFRRLSQ